MQSKNIGFRMQQEKGRPRTVKIVGRTLYWRREKLCRHEIIKGVYRRGVNEGVRTGGWDAEGADVKVRSTECNRIEDGVAA